MSNVRDKYIIPIVCFLFILWLLHQQILIESNNPFAYIIQGCLTDTRTLVRLISAGEPQVHGMRHW